MAKGRTNTPQLPSGAEEWTPETQMPWGQPAEHLIKDGKLLCRECGKSGGLVHRTNGVLPCIDCIEKHRKQPPMSRTKYPEFFNQKFGDKIRGQRREFEKSLIQPMRGGVASKEYIEANPQKAKQQFTPDQIRKAKNVWGDVLSNNWRKSR